MQPRKSVLAGALAISVAACGGGIDVTSDYDPQTDFTSYSTFAVLEEADGGGTVSRLNDERIKRSLAATLTSRGMRQVDTPAEADAAIGYQFTTEDRVSYQTVNTGWGGYGYGYGGGWYGGGYGGGISTSNTTERHYEVGSLIIAIFDTSVEEMIFVSTGTKTLGTKQLSPEETQARIDEAVETILRDFPPGTQR